MRHVYRQRGHHAAALWSSWRYAALPPGTIGGVKAFGARHGAAPHDVFLAALMEAVGRTFQERLTHPHRRGIAIGAIADLRPMAPIDTDNVLGVFLGHFTMSHPAPEQLDFADLVREVAAQAVDVRQRRAFLRNLLQMQVSTVLWPHLSRRAQIRIYSKFTPMAGGLSAANIRAFSRRRREQVGLLEVTRGGSCGPPLPLIIWPTRLGDDLNITAAFRPLGIAEERMEALLARYVHRLANLDG